MSGKEVDFGKEGDKNTSCTHDVRVHYVR
jgi:hypothetical protein